jgi:hypothetical protein
LEDGEKHKNLVEGNNKWTEKEKVETGKKDAKEEKNTEEGI